VPSDDTTMSQSCWFVARTQRSRERWAAENCYRQGAEVYSPQIQEMSKALSAGRVITVARLKPLFPGYLFVRTDGQWRFLLGTFGVIDLILGGGGEPSRVKQVTIDELKSRELGGFIKLPEPQRMFTMDDTVRPQEGPFEGCVGLVAGYTDNERVRVLLDFLGRKVPVLFDEGQLAAA
jgi:transcription antitermination factor NusG